MKTGFDAGHDRTDPGAVSPVRPTLGDKLYTEESDITLAVSKRCQGILLACGHEVVMTRTTDVDISLKQRADLLNAANCDIAVSIHLNSIANPMANYIATFIQGTGGRAEKLGKCIQPKLVKASGWPDGGVRVKNLHMTRETKMPAVLVELGFISNPGEEKQLNDPVFRGRLAAAICEGILIYAGAIQPWQQNLIKYAADPEAGQAELDRAGDVWKKKLAAGDLAGKEAAHKWANTVRQAMGLPTT
ncbi:MAG: N-acetylmuramoyl-L-alanine amidase [Syntrophomonas sp.]